MMLRSLREQVAGQSRRLAAQGLVLGTDFITDVLLVSIHVDAPITLSPGVLATDRQLRRRAGDRRAAGDHRRQHFFAGATRLLV